MCLFLTFIFILMMLSHIPQTITIMIDCYHKVFLDQVCRDALSPLLHGSQMVFQRAVIY